MSDRTITGDKRQRDIVEGMNINFGVHVILNFVSATLAFAGALVLRQWMQFQVGLTDSVAVNWPSVLLRAAVLASLVTIPVTMYVRAAI